ncbi:MAG: hypothetical protein DLM67_19890 [Candidatus Nephthysia bennettiae]|nr:MAG: hypothetical protein DLM67_19890 [Candidatus Dormibacteraeota bacterium]
MGQALTVVAFFDRRKDAEHGVSSLVQAGFPPEQVGYLEPTEAPELKDPIRGVAGAIAIGASSGAVIGGALAAVTVGLVPGVGEALVAGALVPVLLAAVTGSSAGAVAGGLFGAEDEPHCLKELQAGRILVSVEVADPAAEARAAALLGASNALEVDSLGQGYFLNVQLTERMTTGRWQAAAGDLTTSP